ncbi:hypothetical protein COBT_002779 [Conglomerata obtusa]
MVFLVRKGSHFEDLRVEFKEIFKVIFYWANGMINADILKYTNVGETTLAKIKKFLIN